MPILPITIAVLPRESRACSARCSKLICRLQHGQKYRLDAFSNLLYLPTNQVKKSQFIWPVVKLSTHLKIVHNDNLNKYSAISQELINYA